MKLLRPCPFRGRPSLRPSLPAAFRKALGEEHSFGCLLALPPAELVGEITTWVIENCHEEHLGPGGRELRPHVTVKYGFLGSDDPALADELRAFLTRFGPFEAAAGGLALFRGGEDGDVLIAEVESPRLRELNAALSAAFPCEDRHPAYRPHLTLAYLKPEFSEWYLRNAPLPGFLGREFPVERLEWSPASGPAEEIPLSMLPLLNSAKSLPPPGENCPNCGARLERGDGGDCNRCGKPWPVKSATVQVELPDLEQGTSYTCGAVALQAVAEFFGVGPETEEAFAELLGSDPEAGTPPARILELAGKLGLAVDAGAGRDLTWLKRQLDAGRPVLVLIQAWGEEADRERGYPGYEDGHYVVAVGHGGGKIYFEDPSLKGSRGVIPEAEFEPRWHDEDAAGNRYERWGAAFWRPGRAEEIKAMSWLNASAGGALVKPPAFPRRFRLKDSLGARRKLLPRARVKDSYFATCERDETGHCVASGEGGAGGAEKPSGAGAEKVGSEKLRAEVRQRAERLPFSEEVVGEPVDRRDSASIEEAMTPEELEEMEEVLRQQREDWVDDAMAEFSADVDGFQIADDLGYGPAEILEKTQDLLREHLSEGAEEAVEFIGDWAGYSKRHYGGAGLEAFEAALRESGYLEGEGAEGFLEALESLRAEAEEAVTAAIVEESERQENDRRRELEDEYDDTDAPRVDYLREFYDRHEDEPRYSGVDKREGEWQKDDDGYVYSFRTSADRLYEINVIESGRTLPGGVTVPEVQFSDARGEFGVTGAGGAREVLSTVTSAVVAYALRKDPTGFAFTAAERSRRSMYDRLAKTVAAVLPDYSVLAMDRGPVRYYLVVKRDRRDFALGELSRASGEVGAKPEILVKWLPVPPATDSWFYGTGRAGLTPSGLRGRKLLPRHRLKEAGAGTCKPGQRADLVGCTPASRTSSGTRGRKPAEPAERKPVAAKPRASRGEMAAARREGKGKDARVVLADGSPAPAHITPAMIPPAWSDVNVSLDPDADLLVTARDAKGRTKAVYSEKYSRSTAAAKFARVAEMLQKSEAIDAEIAAARKDPATADAADCTWLMRVQATRPGGEDDTKGYARFYDQPFRAGNVEGEVREDKKGRKTYRVALRFGDAVIPVKDQGAARQLLERKESGEGLEDARYWLQSFGATTLEGRHVVEAPDGVRLRFMGKEGVWHDHRVADRALAGMLLARKKKAGPGGKLFNTSAGRVSAFVKRLGGGGFTPKDFRTKRANELAIEAVRAYGKPPRDEVEYKERVKAVAERVSGVLGNDPEMALTSYISPEVFDVWKRAGGRRAA